MYVLDLVSFPAVYCVSDFQMSYSKKIQLKKEPILKNAIDMIHI